MVQKRIIILAVAGIILQAFWVITTALKIFDQHTRVTIFTFLLLYHAAAFLYSAYHAFSGRSKKTSKKHYDILGSLLTLPLLLIFILLHGSYFTNHKPVTISPDQIELYDSNGNKVENDSILFKFQKDSLPFSEIKISPKSD